jgi:cyclin H
MRPLARKLKKCRDPDRSDLVALQKAKREQAMVKGRKGSDVDIEMTEGPTSGALGDAITTREAKRRKMEDPFGGAL